MASSGFKNDLVCLFEGNKNDLKSNVLKSNIL